MTILLKTAFFRAICRASFEDLLPLPVSPSINFSYAQPLFIPLLLMASAVLSFLCSASLRRLRLLASALPEAAAANSRWGVVQPVGHLTVNEDGEGSNPSAPANLIDSQLFIFRFSIKKALSNNWA
jgi:hypothetical protein